MFILDAILTFCEYLIVYELLYSLHSVLFLILYVFGGVNNPRAASSPGGMPTNKSIK